ncbi:MAG: DinB family protein [Omnitrophica WOR_2 bacterium]
MEPFFKDYLERLNKLHTDIRLEIQDLSQEGLNWKPSPEMNSIAVIITHLAGAERYYIGDVAGQEPSNRVRESEFRVNDVDAYTLQELLASADTFAAQVLGRLTLSDLEAERSMTGHVETHTAGWALLHALEHTGLHLGHIQIQLQMWDQSHLAGN